ncbi:hypothetical protein FJTKL_12822 [Diaporthe vaccinii]|uniref:Uncharacterized protein n=1 Tax=Diaporthe vaccinii TaxID=105482 RepID=A0ABR4F9P4_9PEZI
MSWYFSYVYDSDSRQQECFWLDHRGDLKHKEDLEEDWLLKTIHSKMPKSIPPTWALTTNVIPEAGIPEGDRLNDGMRENGVPDYKVPMGVKWHVPALKAAKYGDNIDNLTIDDFALNPAKMHWFTSPMWDSVRRGNPVLPIMHPQASLSDKDPDLIWEDEYNQDIPTDCVTDFYHEYWGQLIPPGTGDRCRLTKGWPGKDVVDCRDRQQSRKARAVDAPAADDHTPSLQERHARTLVNDRNKRGGSGTKELCGDPHSVGPSYANHHEGFFCRMTDKTLWPFCDSAAGVSHDCFDAEAEVLVDKTRPVGKRTLYWDAIEDWHSGDRFKRAA